MSPIFGELSILYTYVKTQVDGLCLPDNFIHYVWKKHFEPGMFRGEEAGAVPDGTIGLLLALYSGTHSYWVWGPYAVPGI